MASTSKIALPGGPTRMAGTVGEFVPWSPAGPQPLGPSLEEEVASRVEPGRELIFPSVGSSDGGDR